MSQTEKPKPPEPLRQNTAEAKLIRQKIWKRLHINNEHFMGVVVGREGFGKSMTGLKFSEVVDPTFHAGRVMFEPKRFLERLQDWKESGETKGKMVVADEAGVGLGTRTWYDKDQIMFNQVLQLIRDENMGIIFTLPRLSELDSQTRGRLHAFIEMTDIDRGNWAEFKWLNWSPARDERDKNYRHTPEMRVGNYTKPLKRLRITQPSEELVRDYQQRKAQFQREFYDSTINEMSDDEADEMSVKEIATEIANGNLKQFVSRHNQTKQPYINKNLIRAEYELSHGDANTVKDLLQRQYENQDLEDYV